jgi:glycosyltransferase involved in cell wall biosynthesis
MKVLLVADGRSPITHNWIKALKAIGARVSLISTFTCNDVEGVERTAVLPVAFSQFSGSQVRSGNASRLKQIVLAPLRRILLAARYLAGPLSVQNARQRFLAILKEEKPDVVQALRIPFEGMLAAATPPEIPLVVSIWGNDLTLHAPGSPWMRKETQQVLERADGLLADTQRDIVLAGQWGFAAGKPSLVIPGSGGIDSGKFSRTLPLSKELSKILLNKKTLILNPRGMRVYVRNDTFFRSIPLVLKEQPDTHFVCVSMAGQPQAERWVKTMGIKESVTLLPFLPQEDVWGLFQRSVISVSISTHDGTPNTLLEAMAAGCFPICGDIASVREWIENEKNGLLVNSNDPDGLAKAILRAIRDGKLRKQAILANQRLVKQKAEVTIVRQQLKSFFKKLHTKK